MKQQTLREWRIEYGLTQEALEALCLKTPTARKKNIQLTQTTISNIEIGRVANPKWDTVCILAEALELDPRALLFAGADAEKQSRLPLKRKTA